MHIQLNKSEIVVEQRDFERFDSFLFFLDIRIFFLDVKEEEKERKIKIVIKNFLIEKGI